MNRDNEALFWQAVLSRVAYAQNLHDELDEVALSQVLQGSPADPLLTQHLADNFATRYEVVAQSSDSILSLGFSATLFKERGANGPPFYFAIRGTETDSLILDVYLADLLGIIGSGAAYSQIVAMANFVTQLTTPVGQSVPLLSREEDGSIAFSPSLIPLQGLATVENGLLDGSGNATLLQSNAMLSSGLSLGGHLSMALARLYGNAVDEAYSFNGAGFSTIWLENQILNGVFAVLGGLSQFPHDRILNVYNPNGPEFITSDFFFNQPGQRIPIYGEGSGHDSDYLISSLAIHWLAQTLDPNVSTDTLNQILRSTSEDWVATTANLICLIPIRRKAA